MAAIEANSVSFSYGGVSALRDLDLEVPAGALYAMLGPNGSGKTTLLQILMGLRRARSGRAAVLGVDSRRMSMKDRAQIAYVAEGQSLPSWMRLEELEAYLAPLYPMWDRALANQLRERFNLDPTRKIGAFSRGGQMKAALLCALAPRPRLLLMDEPFTGMDALVKDELVRGLLASAGSEGWTVLLCSHDIGELELLADWVGFLAEGKMRLSEPLDLVYQRFKRVEVTLPSNGADVEYLAENWLSVERCNDRLSFLSSRADVDAELAQRFPPTAEVTVRAATLREIFVALARESELMQRRSAA
ncbi:MAG TPA: ABC transporter ATP-binding protein [Gemmatimonadaceae bacterium]|nr:ABC transporter ATP-binding protein [Gemmatimonadaceae bacterium]